MQKHDPSHSYTDSSQESPTLTVPPSPPTPPISPHIPPTPPEMSDPFPWLKPRHLKRLFRSNNSSPTTDPSHPTANSDTPQPSPPMVHQATSNPTPAPITAIPAPNSFTEMIRRVRRISRLKKYKSSPNLEGKILGSNGNKYET